MLPKGHSYSVYPQPHLERGQSDQRNSSQRGLTLLDYFAAAALPVAEARLASSRPNYREQPPVATHANVAAVAREAYDLAEAMLAERAERLKGGSTESTPAPTA